MFTLYQEGLRVVFPYLAKKGNACRDCGAGRGDFSIMMPYFP